ncbi:putative GDP-fucose protein O-fucosyltransferase [Lupinus albus]|uniref:O-fucosyltransferase family protein n=1 Tax=Lupinus albus TaxID=3870 RepID=A0A6A4PSR7_LUPAL|nr:putative GDP-fucose protein O-fucosyltransferase [Lupinus albus]
MFSFSRVGKTKSFYRDIGDARELISDHSFEEDKKLKKFLRVKKMSTMDLRQALAGILTLSMFIMLGNMIKKDHFDSYYDVDIQATPNSKYENVAVTTQSLATISHLSKRPWNKENGEGLKPCWNTPSLKEVEQSKGFITFSLTNGPEYHMSQIADALVVARYLGATLVLPDIKGSKPGYTMSLGDIYDVEEFLNSLNGLVRVSRTQPAPVSKGNPPLVRVPSRVTQDYIVKKVQPIYKAKGIVNIESYFPSVDGTIIAGNKNNKLNSFACQGMFGTLKLKLEIKQVVESTVQNLQSWSQNNGQFIAVDLRNECNIRYETGRKLCYQAQEIGEFLKKIGFSEDSAIYVTQTRWNPNLDALKEIFPKTYTKVNFIY